MSKEDANVQAIFAEDIREEINGQFSLIGIFSDSIETTSLPFRLPKLAMLILMSTLIKSPALIKSFRVFIQAKDGTETTVMSHSLPEEVIAEQEEELNKIKRDSPGQTWANLHIKFGGQNLSFDNEARLLVELTSVSGEIYHSNPLTIKKKESMKTPSLSIN